MMKKSKMLILPLLAAMAASTLTACTPEVNQGPEVRGASDITCLANTTVDLLSGVAALDAEDGDITPDLKITVTPEVAVHNGYAVFDKAGDYEVCYEVSDSKGKLARTTVGATVKDREVFMDTMLTNGFALKTGGRTQVLNSGLNGNVFAFKTKGQEIAEDVRLTRTYTLNTNVEYTFTYWFESNTAGRIKAAANGKALEGDINVIKGSNEIKFTYTAEGDTVTDTVEIELWMGGLEGDLEVSFTKAESVYYNAPKIDYVEKLPGFSFEGKTHARLEGVQGTVGTVENGKGVYVDITQASSANWMGGVFVNTGLQLEAGVTYTFSYNVEAQNDEEFEVKLQNKQWDANEFIISNEKGDKEFEYTINGESEGELWIYIASGAHVNKVTLKNLTVKVYKENLCPDFRFLPNKDENGNANIDDAADMNIQNRDGAAQGMYVSEDGKSATIEITKLLDDPADWKMGMFVKTGVQLTSGKTYDVSFDVDSELGNPYDICIQNQKWDTVDGYVLFNPENGHIQKTVTVGGEGNMPDGWLWLYVRSGHSLNKITISNLKVTLIKEEPEDKLADFSFEGKAEGRFEGGPLGTAGTTEDGKGAYVNITKASDANWKGGVFVNTGLNLKEATTYTVSYDVEAEAEGFEVILQNKQWEANEFKKTYSTGHNEFDVAIDADSTGELWLYIASGEHVNNVTLKNLSVTEHKVELVDKLPDFSFIGKTENRDGRAKEITVSDDGSAATIEITELQPNPAIWQIGMFVETGFKLVEGIAYTASYDIEAENDGEFEVKLQKNKFDEVEISKTFGTGHYEVSFVANASTSGDLWIYIASGTNLNKITIKNFRLQADESGDITQRYEIGAVHTNSGSAECEYGKIIYTVPSFGSGETDNDLVSPAFDISGGMGNYIITFKAKATQNVKLLFVPHVNEGWDPTLVWKEMRFTTEEQLFSIRCNDVGVDGKYVFLWRFGYGENTAYNDVTIEISDIKICSLSDLER